MKFLHGFFEWLVFMVVLLQGALALYGATNAGQPCWDALMQTMQQERFMVVMGGIALLLLVVLYLLTSTRSTRPAKTISFNGPNGPVTISMKAVRDFIQRAGDEFSEVISLQPNLDYKGGSLHVELDVRVVAGTHIPELCQMLQERVADSIHEQLGLKEVKNVRINVRELVQRTPAPITSSDHEELS
ncbi:MAG: alkaline shock response membrane anchor protein AmaP [Kiritimatiellae bacterium]|nr:alkaline shock response membrane anchor protein AmaP [Kiritimatiellia bacterium]MDD4735940.1 alkaline shock response membrane anchor protein AmaP [Kiritimatiellia bacterium]